MPKRLTAIIITITIFFLAACGTNNDERPPEEWRIAHSSQWVLELDGAVFPLAELEYFTLNTAIDMELEAFEHFGGFVDLFEPGENDLSVVAVARALEELMQSISLCVFAEYHGVALSPHLREVARDTAEAFLAEYRSRFGVDSIISIERLMVIETATLLFDELIEHFLYRVEVDEEEFEEFYIDWITNHRFELVDMQVSYFLTQDLMEAVEFLAAIETGLTFHEALEEFGAEHYVRNFWHFDHLYLLEDLENDVRTIAAMAEGEHSQIFTMADGYLAVVYMEEVTEPDFDELREHTRIWYEIEAQHAYVWNLFAEFTTTLDFNINHDAIETIDIRSILDR